MKRIDAHQHFWKYDPVRDAWITEEMSVLKRDFLPIDLKLLLQQNKVDASVAVQADQSESETDFLINLSQKFSFIKGIVGWVDLQAPDVRERLEYFSQFPVVKGFRHILQAEKERDKMLQPQFMRGIKELKEFGFTYDILIYSDQLPYIPSFLAAFPDQKFIIDHLAKPDIKGKSLQEWKERINEVAKFENVYCKVSGLVTEADWNHWKKSDFIPYLDTVVEAFGTDRLLYGSDWPVCLVAAEYDEVTGLVADYFSSFSHFEQDQVFGGNAIKFYNLI
jgi:L-fuconolactonase